MIMHPAVRLRFAPAILLGGLVFLGVPEVGGAAAAPIKVACIGEQTTHSDLFPGSPEAQPPGMQEYPRKLQDLLGAGYQVMNFGDCCASVIGGYVHSETHPYVSGKNYKAAVAFAPDIVVIGSWGRHDWGKSAMTALASFTVPAFQTGYEDIIMKFQALPSKPKIFASTLIPIPNGMDGPDNGYKTSPQSDVVTMLATKYSLPTVDLFTAFTGHPELFIQPPMKDSDGEHTSDAGSTKIAQLVAAAITGTAVTPTPAGDAGVPATGSGGKAGGGSGAGGAKGPPAGGSGGAPGDGGVTTGSGGAAPSSSGGAPVVVIGSGSGGTAPASSGGAPVVVNGSGGAPGFFTSGGSTGSVGTGGTVGTVGGSETGAAATPSSSSSGCACSMDAGSSGSRRGAGLLTSAALLGLGLVLRRKRGR
jgi:hypothetical protein